ncbi:MAG: TolC family protein [Bacteroidales bacterium]|nr:TolC family protein [Bacteroidales bacterium]
MGKRITSILLLGMGLQLICNQDLSAQSMDIKLNLGLKDVVNLAIAQSTSMKYVQNRNVNYYWRYQNFRTGFRPQLILNGDIPNYNHTTEPITQPDGSVEFRQVSNIQMFANLALSQSIPLTGTYIYAASSVYRIEDFFNDNVEFSGTPISIGFVQPVFAYNHMKWRKRTEPLLYEESTKDFLESIEEISFRAAQYFFRYLRIQTNYTLAESNLKNGNYNLKIAQTRRELGTISENDFSRIRLSVINAQKALNKARMDLKNADFELKSYIQLEPEQEIELSMPLDIFFFNIDADKALAEALENRKETPQYARRLIEADRQLTWAKRNSGLNATLRGNYGMSNVSSSVGGIYKQPEQQKQVRLSLSIPILDWGRSTSRIKMAESQRELVLYDVANDKRDFEREIVVQVEQFSLLKDQMTTSEEADKVAANGYEIALKKFQNGEISITDLNISLQERETAKRDYITSLEDYWEAYYRLRILTLYDFEMQEKIWYPNPMLNVPRKNKASVKLDP